VNHLTISEAMDRACAAVGIRPPRSYRDGRWTRTDTSSGKNGKGDGSVMVDDERVTAWNWQTGEKETVWLSSRERTAEDRKVTAARISAADEKRRRAAVRAAEIASALLSSARQSNHPYLAAKGFREEQTLVVTAADVRELAGHVNHHGEFIPADYLVAGERAILIPARRAGNVTSAQLVWENGTKKFLFGGEIGGASHRLATGVYTWLCEGYATGLSIRAALKGLRVRATVLCCFSASNIVAVAQHVQGRAFVATDNDKPLEQFAGLGTGEHYARLTSLPYAMPAAVGDDFNDMHQRDGIFAVQRVLTAVMARRVAT